ncbi:MAG: TolC family protein [Deltaproteobacteria bacterium]|jgi:outer membrane protein TolC|nr:TolC family protein [Deltaproteobacteria bacterium]MBW2531666.1 TolC family protein [Deltaproteobacteria bacterium]
MLSRRTTAALSAAATAWVVALSPSARAQPEGKDGAARPEASSSSAEAKATRPASGRGASLARCLQLAERHHPDLLAARARLRHVRAQLLEAYSAPFFNFRATGGASLAPTVRGNNVYSPNTDQSLTSSLGMAWRVTVNGVLPLWTFGKITNLWDAAEANVKVKEAEVDVTRDAIRMDVRRAYFGLQVARDGLDLLDDAQSKLDEAVQDMTKKVDQDEGDPIKLLKLRTFAAEFVARRAEAERFEQIALAGLRFYTGDDRLDIPDEPIREAAHQLLPLARYRAAAKAYRPDVRMAKAGVEAREAQVRQHRSNMFPSLGLALSAGLAAAPEVANQINPFVSDPGNYFHYGVALVFEWKLDVVPQVARIQQAQAQLDEVLALEEKATSGVAAEVAEAYAEAADWRKRLTAYRKASKLSKQWLSTVQQAIDVGTMDDDEIMDPAKSYAEHRYNVLRAIMEYNVALSKLSKVTGWDAIAPER